MSGSGRFALPAARGLGLLLILGCLAQPAAGSDEAFLPPGEIRAGMKGIARTVFQGNRARSFEVELLGVVPGTRPKGDLILFRALGDSLAHTGVVAGMSGSPVYVDGRLVGAIAFSYPFAKDAIGMITPIGEMLEGVARVDEPPSAWMGTSSTLYEPLRQNFLARTTDVGVWDRLAPGSSVQAGSQALVALWASGWLPEVEAAMGRVTDRAGLPRPVLGGGSGSKVTVASADSLAPGSAVAVQLVDGDATLAAVGTLTFRDGDRIAAFGHPIFQGGSVSLPLASAWIHGVIPSYNNSFKIGSPGPIVGSIRQDLRAGVAGVIGQIPSTLPVRITLNGPAGRDGYHYRIARGTALEPNLLAWAVSNSLLQHGWRTGDASVDARLTVHYNGSRTLSRRDRITTRSPSNEVAERLLAPVPLLLTNPFSPVRMDSVTLDVAYAGEFREATVVDVWADQETVRPGAVLSLSARIKDRQSMMRELRVAFPVPERWHGRTLLILAGGAQDLTEWDQDRAPSLYEPTTLEGLERLVESFPDEGDLLIRIYGEAEGVVIGDHEIGPLPESVVSVLGSRQKRGPARGVPNPLLEERRIDAGDVVTGGMAVRVTVE